MKRGVLFLLLPVILGLVTPMAHAWLRLTRDDRPRWKAFVRVKTPYRNGQVKVWTSDDGTNWSYVSSSAPYLPTEREVAQHPTYVFPLMCLPAYLRVGVTGPFLGRTSVDHIEVRVGDRVRKPLSSEPVGEVIDPANVGAADGKTAILVHRGQTEQVDGLVARFKPTHKPPSRRPRKTYFGNYTSPGHAGDRLADAIAWWDFTVFQCGAKLEECVRKVKQRNPNHRVVLRLGLYGQSLLLYAYDPPSRDAIRRKIIGQFASFADLVDTVTLSEEEPGNILHGIYGSPIPPESVYLWRYQFERETGRPFVWPSNEVDAWLGRHLQAMLNDLYDVIKNRFPTIQVYQWVELRGYGNISGYPEYVRGESLKMDGFVVEWSAAGEMQSEELVETPLGKGAVCTTYFARYLKNLKARNGLKPSQILGQVWAFDPTLQPTRPQIEGEQDEGVAWIYFFWPNAAVPEVFDLCGENDGPDWKYAHKVWKQLKPTIEAEMRRQP